MDKLNELALFLDQQVLLLSEIKTLPPRSDFARGGVFHTPKSPHTFNPSEYIESLNPIKAESLPHQKGVK